MDWTTDIVRRISSAGWAVLGVTLPFVFYTEVYEGALLPRLVVLQLGLLLLCLFLLFTKRPTVPKPLLLTTGALIATAALSTTQSVNTTESLLQLAHYVPLLLIPLIVTSTLEPGSVARTLVGWVGAGAIISVIGISQYFGLAFEALPSSANPSATFYHRNAAAEYLIGIIPFGWYLAQRASARWPRTFYIAITALCTIYLVFTRCRGAWIGLSIAALIVWIAARRSPSRSLLKGNRQILGVLAAAALLAFFLPDRITTPGAQHFDEKKDSALSALTSIADGSGHRGRFNLWSHTLRMSLDHPLLGVGLGNWEFIYPDYARGDQMNVNASPRRPHNDLLWILSETGIAGLAAFAVLVLLAVRSGLNALARGDRRALAAACLVVVLAHLGDGVFNFPRERVTPAFLFWFACGGLWVIDPRPSPLVPSRGIFVGAGCLILLATYVTATRLAYDVYHLRVHRAERQQDWDQVIRQAEAASEIGDYRANTFIALGRAHERQGRPVDAIAAYRRALVLHPHSLNAHNNVAIALRKTRDYDGAEQAAKRAIELNPRFPEAYNNLGNIYRDRSQWSRAIEAFERALEFAPHNPVIRVNLGRALAASGDLTGAEQQARNTLALAPDFGPALRLLTQIKAARD